MQSHVQDIVDYLDSDPVIFPNALIMALSSTVKFVSGRGPKTTDGLAIIGTLTLPLPSGGQARPAWIVDGQQRAVALSRAASHGTAATQEDVDQRGRVILLDGRPMCQGGEQASDANS